ncbi:MAG TPA: hypothetical protein VFQ65_26815, partial [Kofleriaceae bacterium]|nr:hypothetical protein [Kofleriaceae bacterium]
LISQVTGDPVYADDGTQHWTVATIEANGNHLVAGKLRHCTGSYARAASAPPAVPFTELADGETLATRATAQLLHSATGREARAQLATQYTGEGNPPLDFASVTETTTKVARDPRTGTTWVAVHVHADFSCGGPDVNIFGLYRTDDTGLVTLREQPSPDLAGLQALVDLDGDGIPELLGNGWLTPNRAFYDQDLRTLVTYDVPFFGCPC